MEEKTYGSPEVVVIVRRLFEQEKNTSILPDDPRKAEVEELGLPDHFYNTVCELLWDKPNITVSYVIRYLDAAGFGVERGRP